MAIYLALANEDMRSHTNNGPTDSIMALPHSPQIHIMERTCTTIEYEGIEERQYNTNPMNNCYHAEHMVQEKHF